MKLFEHGCYEDDKEECIGSHNLLLLVVEVVGHVVVDDKRVVASYKGGLFRYFIWAIKVK